MARLAASAMERAAWKVPPREGFVHDHDACAVSSIWRRERPTRRDRRGHRIEVAFRNAVELRSRGIVAGRYRLTVCGHRHKWHPPTHLERQEVRHPAVNDLQPVAGGEMADGDE